MRLKSFHGATLAEAMGQVRTILGDDAIIVATREEKNGAGVRVTAAIEDSGGFQIEERPAGPEPDANPAGIADTIVDRVAAVLMRHGVPGSLADRILDSAAGMAIEDPGDLLAACLDRSFAFAPLDQEARTSPLMIVGPPGAGKTLMIAKLATQAHLAHRSVALLTTDTVRAGGVEQLQAFTRILGLDLMSVEDPESLGDAVETVSDHDLILIDTDGRIPFDSQDMKGLARLVKAAGAEPVLALPAGGDAEESAEIARCFEVVGVRRMVAARVDAARRLGGLLTAAEAGRLSFAGVTASPRAAERVQPLTPTGLARLMMPLDPGEEDRKANTGPRPPSPDRPGRSQDPPGRGPDFTYRAASRDAPSSPNQGSTQ